MREILSRLRFFLESFPCIFFLAGVLNGFAGLYLFSGRSLFLSAIPGLLTAWWIFGLRNTCIRFIPAVLLALLSAILHLSARTTEFSFELSPTGKRSAEALFQLKDSSLCGGIPEQFKNAPFFIQAELRGIADEETGIFQPDTGTVLITVSPGSQDLDSAGYNDLIRCRGYFEEIPQKILHGTFDFESYCHARGCFMLFRAETFQLEKRGSGCFRNLYDLRGRFLTELVSNMCSDTAMEMAPALFFGIRQTIQRDLKNDFLTSGTLHILSVSGFHIGLFFLAVMLFFRWIPHHIRWLAAPVPVLIYALSTGMQAPAFRAFIMLFCWCLSQAFLRKSKSGNILACAAAVILLIQPYQLFDAGFLYSFGCVFFLLLCSGFFFRIKKALTLREQFLPERKRFSFLRIRSYLILSIGSAIAAWLCSIVLTLSFQSLFTPYAVPAYLLMSPFVLICFLLFLPGLFSFPIPGAAQLFGEIMEYPLFLTAKIAEYFSGRGALFISPPPNWLVILFLAANAGIFLFRKKRFLYPCAFLLFFAGLFSLVSIPAPGQEIAVIRQGGVPEPAIILSDPASGRALLWNIPSGATAQLAADYLRTSGIGTVEEIHFDSVRQEICGGGELFLRRCNANALFFWEKIPANAKTAAELRKMFPGTDSAPVMKLSRNGNITECSPQIAGMERLLLRKTVSEDRGISLEIFRDGTLLHRKEYPYSNDLILDRIKL